MRVIGTAGHVDHGKSTLITALTGINPDRLKEEREREMTVDLGFAWLTLPDGEPVSIVDVPGHEDFIKNMLAGVGGIDAALLVVAADEGVMPQTREHVAILDLLQVKSGVVALTKIDLMDDPEWLDLVREEIHEYLAGTALASAPIIAVSARTGQGLDALLVALQQAMEGAPPRPDRGRPRLPIDRVFSMPGFGTIVTGTLSDGTLHVGQEVAILPRGTHTRIRGLQTHKQKVDVAAPASRVAANLVGVDLADVARGDVLAAPGSYLPTDLFDARLQLLRDAAHALPHNATIDLFIGASETPARLRLLDRQELAPGEEAWVQLETAVSIVAAARDRFIIRQPSPSATLGGGYVVDPRPGRRHRRFQRAVFERLQTLAHGTPEDILLQALERLGPAPTAALLAQAGLPRDVADAALAHLRSAGQVLPLSPENPAGALIGQGQWQSLAARMRSLVEAYHDQYPLRPGMPREELKSRLNLEPRIYADALQRAAAEGLLEATEAITRVPGYQPRYTPEQERRMQSVLANFVRNPYSPPSAAEAEAELGAELLASLIEQGRLVRLSDAVLLTAEAYHSMLDQVLERLRRGESVTVATVRDLFGSSRKYALAFLEYLDRQHITRRIGDERVLQ